MYPYVMFDFDTQNPNTQNPRTILVETLNPQKNNKFLVVYVCLIHYI
jgi:hypothetical protein